MEDIVPEESPVSGWFVTRIAAIRVLHAENLYSFVSTLNSGFNFADSEGAFINNAKAPRSNRCLFHR
jgi:hypothetical protein